MLYFAYGSNMDQVDLDRWCEEHGYLKIDLSSARKVRLNDYKLQFNYYSSTRRGGAANVMDSESNVVWGLLILLTEEERRIIQEKEGCPSGVYKEIRVEVEDEKGIIMPDVITYKVVKEKEEDGHVPPTSYYLNLLINSARKYDFPAEYIKHLELVETKSENSIND